jgi:outer membrane protein assembly factor BamB
VNVLRLVGSFSAAGLLLFSAGSTPAKPPPRSLAAAVPPTTVSSRNVVANAGPILRIGNTVYVAGVERVASPTGSVVILSAANGRTDPVAAPVTGGSVRAAITDNAGGWYIGGTFTSVGGVLRPGLAHLASDGTLDKAFAPPELGQVRALVLDAGRLYVGGVRPLAAAPWFQPFLHALDPATGAVLPVSYPPLTNIGGPPLGVIALAAGDGRLYAAFNGPNGIAAYSEGSGALLWSQSGTPSETFDGGPAALALADGRLLVGGRISTPTGQVDLEEFDPATGTVVGQPAVGGPVTGIATIAATAYIVAGPAHGESVFKLDLPSGALTRRAACKFCAAVTTDGKTLYVAKRAPVGGDLRVYALKLTATKPRLQALSQVTVGGSANALALQSGHLLLGGSFLGLGGTTRSGLAAFDARTGALLPWNPKVQGGGVTALAHSGKTIYLGGQFSRAAGKSRSGLAAVSALGTGKLLPWRPRLANADVRSLAVAEGRVFAGGIPNLVAFSAGTGKRLAFRPRIHGVTTLVVWHRLLLAGSVSNQGIWGASVAAFRLGGQGRTVWRRSVTGGNVPIVFALQPDGSTLYVGGRFTQIDGQARTNLAALALDRSGKLLDFAPQLPNQVMALARTRYGLVFSTMELASPSWLGTQALGAVTTDGRLLPWQVGYPPSDVVLSTRDPGGALNGSVESLAVVPGGLLASGGFSWIGPGTNAAPGGLVWLR